jgi:hypothetical protein
MTSQSGLIVMMAVAGAFWGVLYFALLWLSVRLLPLQRGTIAFILLALARAILITAGLALAFIIEPPLSGIAAAVAGFILVRVALTRVADPTAGGAPWT